MIFIKRGYSFLKHLVPFAVAALLLLMLSVPADNLLLKLASLLQGSLRQPDLTLVPAVLLTVVATIVYVFSVYAEVRGAYLLPEGDVRRTVITCALYISLCSLMAFGVLQSAPPPEQMTSLAIIWTSYLIAIFSLTGIGWSRPTSWVENVGVKVPDYTGGRAAAQEMTEVLARVRSAERGTRKDVEDFSSAAEGLQKSVDDNLALEPDWAEEELKSIKGHLATLMQETKDKFPTDGNADVADFAAACRCQKSGRYRAFIGALQGLGTCWKEWQCPQEKKRSPSSTGDISSRIA